MRRPSVGRLAVHLVLAIVILFRLVPALGLLVTSFRTGSAAATSGWWTEFAYPQFTSSAYRGAFEQVSLGRGLLNSLLVTIPANVVLVSFATVVGYVFGRMRFRGRDVVFMLTIALMALPPQMALGPLFQLFSDLGLTGHYASMWIFQGGFVMPLAVLILRNFFASIPDELFEAAEVDGAGPASTFFAIALPLALPGILSVFIFQFIFSWNDLMMPLVLLGASDKATVTIQIAGMVGSTTADNQTLVAASAIVSVIVPLVVFFALQRYFVRGLMSGAVKG